MPCLFQRNFIDKCTAILLRDVTPGCEWVLNGEGTASRKYDGTACAVIDGQLYKRYDLKLKNGVHDTSKLPPGAIACDVPDTVTGHWPHWVKVGEEPESKWHREAWRRSSSGFIGRVLLNRTYELCGPHFSANPEKFEDDVFVEHGSRHEPTAPRSFDGLSTFLATYPGEGLVFAHPDGRMCKIRCNDFGYAWPIP